MRTPRRPPFGRHQPTPESSTGRFTQPQTRRIDDQSYLRVQEQTHRHVQDQQARGFQPLPYTPQGLAPIPQHPTIADQEMRMNEKWHQEWHQIYANMYPQYQGQTLAGVQFPGAQFPGYQANYVPPPPPRPPMQTAPNPEPFGPRMSPAEAIYTWEMANFGHSNVRLPGSAPAAAQPNVASSAPAEVKEENDDGGAPIKLEPED